MLEFDPLATQTGRRSRKQRRRRREIIRRQVLLRNAGYKIVVDGTWGPKSQRSWQHYLKHRSVVFTDKPQDNLDLTKPGSAPTPKQGAAEWEVQKQVNAQQIREREAKRKRELERAAILKRAALLRKNPELAKNLNVHQISMVLSDKEVDYHPDKNPNLTKALQYFLRSRGYKMPVDGVLSEKTKEALEAEFRKQFKIEQRRKVEELSKRIYDSGLVKPGDKPAWWGLGAFPTPEKLLQMIEQGGFMGTTAFLKLASFAFSPEVGFALARNTQLSKIAENLAPYSTSSMLAAVGGPQAVEPWQYAIDILSVQDLAPIDYSAMSGMTQEQQIAYMQKRAGDKDVQAENLARRLGVQRDLKTLLGSNNADQYQRKFMAETKRAEKKFEAAMLERASQEKAWWGKTLEAIAWTGEISASLFISAGQTLTGALSLTPTAQNAGRRQPNYVTPFEAHKWEEEQGFLFQMAIEMGTDPLMFLRPLRLVSTGASVLAGSAGRAALFGRYVRVGEGANRLLIYNKGVVNLGSVNRAFWKKGVALPVGIVGNAVIDPKFTEKMAHVAELLSKTNNEMLGAVSKRAQQAARLGWKPVRYALGGEADFAIPKYASPEGVRLMEIADRGAATFFEDATFTKVLLEEMKANGGSFYLTHNRADELSQYGASFSAHLAQLATPMYIARKGMEVADSVLEREWDAELQRLGLEAEKLTPKQADSIRAVALQKAQAEYDRTVRMFENYLAGGYDLALKDFDEDILPAVDGAARDLAQEVRQEITQFMHEVDRSLLPMLQDQLERHAQATFDAAQALAKKSADEVRARATKGAVLSDTGSLALNLKRIPDGNPGPAFWRDNKGGASYAVFRDDSGEAVAYVRVNDNLAVDRYTAPEFRRQGLQDKLDAVLEGQGIRISELSGRGLMSEEGAALVAGRIEKAASEHPIWDKDGLWRGRHAAQESKIVGLIRKSFDEDELATLKNPQHGKGYNDVDMRAAIREEMGRRLFRINDYAARKIVGDMIPEEDKAIAALSHELREEAIEKEVKNSWHQHSDGLWYDNRPTVKVSKLYTRAYDDLTKKQLIVDKNGQVDMLASLGTNQPFDKMTRLEIDMYNLAAAMTGISSKRIPGTEARTHGIRWGGSAADRALTEREAAKLRELIDTRQVALGEFEKAAIPKMMMENGAVWRAWQHAQGRKMQLAYKALSAQLMFWKFATLALRPAWAIRNFIDNIMKAIIAGCRDPRLFVVGPGQAVGNAIGQGLNVLRDFMVYCDTLYGTEAARHFDEIVNVVWTLPSHQLSKLFQSVMIDVPPEVFEMNLRRDILEGKAVGLRLSRQPSLERQKELGIIDEIVERNIADRSLDSLAHIGGRFRDIAFHIVGDLPENYARRIVYRDAFKKARERMLVEHAAALDAKKMPLAEINLRATDEAIKSVEDTLFDYSAISVAEDNLKLFFPFIQFWRKNSVFWAANLTSKPWLPLSVAFFDQNRRDAHADSPQWMQRYFHTDEITDALGVVPGIDAFFEKLGLGNGAMFDPISLTSMAPFYRAFKSENQFLPTDHPGIPFISGLIDGLNDWGLGLNPFFRKPLEGIGVANRRAWQKVFPQTSLALAIADRIGGKSESALRGMAESLEIVGTLGTAAIDKVGPNDVADNYDYWVQTVVAEQVARGEMPDIAKAEQVVKDWFLVLNLWGYFGGIYWRRATPEDLYLAKLQDDVFKGEQDYDNLTKKEKNQLHFWAMRGQSRLMYDNYVGLYPIIKAYYKADVETKDEIKTANPEIIRWVDGDFRGKPVSQKFVRHTARYVDQEIFFAVMEFADTLDVPQEVRQAAEDYYLSPELKRFWKNNATPTRIRERMLQAEVREYYKGLHDGFFAIPESDFEARNQYLDDHPDLQRHWNANNSPADDLEAVMNTAKADLRDTYFSIVEAHGGDDKGFEAAADFLKQYPFIFEGTKSESKVKDGEWIPGAGKWSAERISLYLQVKPHLHWFFKEFMPKVGEKQAWGWLEKTESENGTLIRDYLNKYPSTKRLDYLKAQPWLKRYFGMPPADRGAWLRGGSEGAKIVLWFFEKYGDKESQHAKDYLAVKKDLEYYGTLPKEKRNEWLNSDDPRAARVLAFFKKYGKNHQFERAFKKLVKHYPGLKHGTPEQALRMKFWKQYFELTPDQRPAFVHAHAEDHGVFVYGEFGEKYMYDKEQEYMRKAIGIDISEKVAAYLYAKPLLEFYKTLNEKDRVLFAKANPEVQWYFDNFSKKSVTGDKKLDALVEQYFKFPADSLQRSAFLRKHPEVQDWFDKRSSPAERAMRARLEHYFSLDGPDRSDYLDFHPEIQAWFDARRQEKADEMEQLQAFDDSDPRLAPFYQNVEDMGRAAALMRAKLGNRALKAYDISTRRERRT